MSRSTLARAPGSDASVRASPAFSSSSASEPLAAPPSVTADAWGDMRLRVPSRSHSGSAPIAVPVSPPLKRDTPRYQCVSESGKVAPVPVMVQQMYPQTILACSEVIAQLDRASTLPQAEAWRCLGAGLDVEDILALEPVVYAKLPQLLLVAELEKLVQHRAARKPPLCDVEIFAHCRETMVSLSEDMFTLIQNDLKRLPRLAALLRFKAHHGDDAWSPEAASDAFRADAHGVPLHAMMRSIRQLADATLQDESRVLAQIVHVASCAPGISRLSRHA